MQDFAASVREHVKNTGTRPVQAVPVSMDVWRLKWSGEFGQRAKVYPTRMNGYENDEATELFRQV